MIIPYRWGNCCYALFMEKRDFRSHGRSAQEELRRRAVFLLEHDGLSQGKAARLIGVERQAVNIWVRRYRTAGEDGLLDGRQFSAWLGLTPSQYSTGGKDVLGRISKRVSVPIYGGC